MAFSRSYSHQQRRLEFHDTSRQSGTDCINASNDWLIGPAGLIDSG